MLATSMVEGLAFGYNKGVRKVLDMKWLKAYAFELCIALMGFLLIGNIFFSSMVSDGFYTCMLILFLISLSCKILYGISERMKDKTNRGGIL